MSETLTCMFCEKSIKNGEVYVISPFNDGTDAHTLCGDEAVLRYGMTHLK